MNGSTLCLHPPPASWATDLPLLSLCKLRPQEVLESRVDAGAVARNSTDWPAAIGFLLRRNSTLYSVDLPQLALSLMKVQALP